MKSAKSFSTLARRRGPRAAAAVDLPGRQSQGIRRYLGTFAALAAFDPAKPACTAVAQPVRPASG